MIVSNVNGIESLGSMLGVSVAAPPADAPDFAALLSAASASPGEAPVAAVMPGLVQPPVGPTSSATSSATPPAMFENIAPVALPVQPTAGSSAGMMPSAQLPVAPDSSQPAAPVSLSEAPSNALVDDDPGGSVAPDQAALSPRDAVLPLLTVQSIQTAAVPDVPAPTKPVTIERPAETATRAPVEMPVAVAPFGLAEPIRRKAGSSPEKPEAVIALATDQRPAALLPALERAVAAMPDRAATFAPFIADAVRDLVAVSQTKHVRFNVRPETLGPVAVTIERSDGGAILRLAVETQAAVQAVRQAEPLMNDARGNAPFVQVSVDMTAPDGRGRSPRPMMPINGAGEQISNPSKNAQPVLTGRYA